jgi:hypothetical protein
MTQQDEIEAIQRMQNTQGNIKVFTAIPMGVLMILYFFTYATLVDKGMTALLVLEIVTTILFVLALIYLNQLSFYIIRQIFKNKRPYKDLLMYLTHANINDKAVMLSDFINQQRLHSSE